MEWIKKKIMKVAKKKALEQLKEEKRIVDVTYFSMRQLKPIIGGHLEHGFVMMKSFEKEMANGVHYYIHVSTWDEPELKKYHKKLEELGFVQGRENPKYYEKELFTDEIAKIHVKLKDI